MKLFNTTRAYKKLFFLLGFALLSIATARFTHFQTKGFRLTKIAHNLPLTPREHKQRLHPSTDLNSCFKQRFHFLGRGFESFVFLSEDGSTILKLFNNRYQHQIKLYSLLASFPFLHTWALEHKKLSMQKLEASFNSYELSFDLFSEYTALKYLHLSATQDLPPALTLIDPLHIEHVINPNKYSFLLQKRVDLVYPALKQFLEKEQLQEAKNALSSLIQLFIDKYHKGLIDSDPLIRTNYGFMGTQAIQLDVGPLSLAKDAIDKKQFQTELLRIMASLKNFLNQESKELSCYLDQELQNALSSLE